MRKLYFCRECKQLLSSKEMDCDNCGHPPDDCVEGKFEEEAAKIMEEES